MPIAIACMSGSFKGVFVHGALAALEEMGIRAAAYAAASSSTLTAAYAAIGQVRTIGMEIWTDSEVALQVPGTSMSDVVLANIDRLSPGLAGTLFNGSAARLLVATSRVVTQDAAELTQGSGARRLGRKLLIDSARSDGAWAAQHLVPHLYDTRADDPALLLTAANFREVAYATTRMMHAWPIPATISGEPYIDASYTCLCPALELAALGYTGVVAIATEPGSIRRHMFTEETLPAGIHLIQPDCDLKELGVDFAAATHEGLDRVFAHGAEKAREFAASAACAGA